MNFTDMGAYFLRNLYNSYSAISSGTDASRYAIPFLGSSYRSLDQYADYQKMQADFARNVGRQILYPSIRGYQSNATSAMGSVIGNSINGAGRTVRSLI